MAVTLPSGVYPPLAAKDVSHLGSCKSDRFNRQRHSAEVFIPRRVNTHFDGAKWKCSARKNVTTAECAPRLWALRSNEKIHIFGIICCTCAERNTQSKQRGRPHFDVGLGTTCRLRVPEGRSR